jgi:DNA topoisomerase-3
MVGIKDSLINEARKAKTLILWLDCDREGENISYEVIQVCKIGNPRLNIYRARFSSVTVAEIKRAAERLI